MNVLEVIGIRYLSFPDKNDPGKQVTGMTLYCTKEIDGKNGIGKWFDEDCKLFISEWLLSNRLNGVVPGLHDKIEVIYNSKGKIADIRILTPAAV